MKATGLIDQLLNIHRNLDALGYTASLDAGLGRAGYAKRHWARESREASGSRTRAWGLGKV
jgi:hypothetical protein